MTRIAEGQRVAPAAGGEESPVPRSSGKATARRGRRDTMLLAGVLLIVLQAVVRAWVALPSWYWQDDFVHMEMAGRLGLSEDFLVRGHNGHLEVGVNLVYWLIGRDAGLSFVPAAICLVVLQLIASCLLLAVLRQLFGRSPWLLLPFAGYLFTPLALPVATWWAAGLEALPLHIGMLLALLGLVRALRGRSWRWAVVSVAGHGFGLLFYEKALAILPAMLAVVVLVEWAGEPLGRRLRLLWAARWYVLPHGLLVAAYVPVYVAVVNPSAGLDPSEMLAARPAETLPAIGETVLGMLLPGLFGGPWTDTGAQNTVFPDPGTRLVAVFVLLALAVVATSVWLRGRRALQGWLLLTSYVAADVALVHLARTEFVGLVTRDPRYLTDALPVIAIGVCAAFTGPLAERRTPRWFPRVAGSTGSALGASALLVTSCLVTTSLLVDGLQHRPSREWVDRVLTAMDDADPGVSVMSGGTGMVVNIFRYPDLAGLLRAVGQERRFDRPGTDVRIFDGDAVLRPVEVIHERLSATGPVADCGWPMSTAGQRLGELPGPFFGLQVLQLDYRTDSAATLQLAVGDDEQTLALPPGRGTATFVINGQVGPVEARVSESGPGSLCVSGLVVGAPWPAGVPPWP